MSEPRRHHYVPESLLAGFTIGGTPESALHVFDKSRKTGWISSPRNAAHERDFYRLDIEPVGEEDGADGGGEDLFAETDPLAVENFFGLVESNCMPAIREVLRRGDVPDDREVRTRLIEFMGAQIVRVPAVLGPLRFSLDQTLRTAAWYMATPAERALLESGDIVVSFGKDLRLRLVLQLLPILAEELGRRHWTLVVAEDGAPDFICSDRPVTVLWSNTAPRPGARPSLDDPGTAAMLPLSRRAALLGMNDGSIPDLRANAKTVGQVNASTYYQASRFAFSAEPEFKVTLADGRIVDRRD